MGPNEWITLAALVLSIFVTSGAVIAKQSNDKNEILQKISDNKIALESELGAIRMSAYEEYKTLRHEMHEGASMSYREFGESVAAIREKVTQVELWIRDQLSNTRHTLGGSMDMRHSIVEEKLEAINERLRQLELSGARTK